MTSMTQDFGRAAWASNHDYLSKFFIKVNCWDVQQEIDRFKALNPKIKKEI